MENQLTDEEKLKWFGGNVDALNVYKMFITLSHTWDDIIDKKEGLSDDAINEAFRIALVYLPANKFYYSILPQILPMWLTIIAAYETGNTYEKTKDAHGIEISHSLRYAAGHIIAYSIILCVGSEKAKEFLPVMWKDVFYERFDMYREEHLND